jgi:hypothetical protein
MIKLVWRWQIIRFNKHLVIFSQDSQNFCWQGLLLLISKVQTLQLNHIGNRGLLEHIHQNLGINFLANVCVGSNSSQQHKFAVLPEYHTLAYPVQAHMIMRLKPIHPNNDVVASQGQHLEVRRERSTLTPALAANKFSITHQFTTISNLDLEW